MSSFQGKTTRCIQLKNGDQGECDAVGKCLYNACMDPSAPYDSKSAYDSCLAEEAEGRGKGPKKPDADKPDAAYCASEKGVLQIGISDRGWMYVRVPAPSFGRPDLGCIRPGRSEKWFFLPHFSRATAR